MAETTHIPLDQVSHEMRTAALIPNRLKKKKSFIDLEFEEMKEITDVRATRTSDFLDFSPAEVLRKRRKRNSSHSVERNSGPRPGDNPSFRSSRYRS